MFGKIIFVSHQWCSFDHPDPLGEQFAALRDTLRKLAKGGVRRVQTTKFAEQYMGEKIVVGAKEWKQHLPDMFIWMDWMSVLQPDFEAARRDSRADHVADAGAQGKTIAELRADQEDAVQSIPAYVECSTVMILLVPVVSHKDLDGQFCGYDSWRDRGWCRVELMGAHLSRNRLRIMIVRGGKTRPRFSGTHEIMALPTLEGRFTCCERGHVSKSGTPIPCDKPVVSQILHDMLQAKVDHQGGGLSQTERRYFTCAKAWFCREGSCIGGGGREESLRDDQRGGPPGGGGGGSGTDSKRDIHQGDDRNGSRTAVDRLVSKLKWTHADDNVGRKTGFSLLAFAVIANDLAAVVELLSGKANEAAINLRIRNAKTSIGIPKGATPLILSMIYSSWDVVSALLANGADPNVLDGLGRDGLLWGATQTRPEMVKRWIDAVGTQNVDRAMPDGATPLACAVQISSQGLNMAKVLHEAGAKLTGTFGGFFFNALIASTNGDSLTADLVRYLASLEEIDVNVGSKAVTWQIKTLVRAAKAWRCLGLKMPRLLKTVARIHNATPLHMTVCRGLGNATAALLEAGADSSLRNGLGQTPLQAAEATYRVWKG